MSKFKKGFVTGVKKEEAFAKNQEELHSKYHVQNNQVIIVEKNHVVKFLINKIVALFKLFISIALYVLATIGLLTLIYPVIRTEFFSIMIQIYDGSKSLIGL